MKKNISLSVASVAMIASIVCYFLLRDDGSLSVSNPIALHLEKDIQDNPRHDLLLSFEPYVDPIDIEINDEASKVDRMKAYMLEAYESGDAAALEARVRELLYEDFYAALDTFALLDYTFLYYQMTFPHDIVSEFLETHFEDSEVMELMSFYIEDSSILNSVLSVFFVDWAARDHVSQIQWLSENNTFNDDRVIAKYVESVGLHDVGSEMTRLIGELPEDDFRKPFLHQKAMGYLAGEQPEAFVDYLSTLDSIPEYADDAISNVVYGFAESVETADEMNTLAEWIDLVHDEGIRDTSLAVYSAQFAYSNPEEFTQWYETLEFNNPAEKEHMSELIEHFHKGIISTPDHEPEIEDTQGRLPPYKYDAFDISN